MRIRQSTGSWSVRSFEKPPPWWFKRRKEILIAIAVLIIAWFLPLLFKWRPPTDFPEITNRIKVGDSASKDVYLSYEEPILSAEALLDPENIIEIRNEGVKQAASLIKGSYSPSDAIFAPIRPGRPWFSLAGLLYHGNEVGGPFPGPVSEIRSIANPFMFIVPEFWGLSIWTENSLKWNKEKITDEILASKDFPLCPRPRGISVMPGRKESVMSYNITQYLRDVNKWTTTELTADKTDFSVIGYNARDWGYKYLSMDINQSKNVTNPNTPPEAAEIKQSLGWSPTLCGTSEGCNNREGAIKGWDMVRVTQLPAEAVFQLWYDQPNLQTTPPDYTYRIIFQ